MHQEIETPTRELESLAQRLAKVFIQRRDLYARQQDDGSYLCLRKPLQDWHLQQHLVGKLTLGAYVLSPQNQTRFIAIDADDNLQLLRLAAINRSLASQGVPAYLELSRRGGHLWVFFEELVSGRDARQFGQGILQSQGLSDIELFPKQDCLQNGPGSLIRLPFGIHRKSGERYGFVNPDGTPLAENLVAQVNLLTQPSTVGEAAFDTFWTLGKPATPPHQKAELHPKEVLSGTLSQRIKASVSVPDFVAQYVELAPSGRGLCPFHDDVQASFSVHAEKNYWHCFAGCGGGSIIDFWMKRQDCDFTTAVRELSQMLLK